MINCPYCHMPAKLVDGRTVYPHRPDLAAKRFWHCAPCGAYVGCHPNTDRPLGRLANASLRAKKIQVHNAFDPLWKHGGTMTRRQAYQRLAETMGIAPDECHVGMFDEHQCLMALIAISILADSHIT